ncbi:hypothetical protein C0993_001211 [Termitomyces sp. T159_Od127]|nr:hypothetical protein C0993_001211 [Termitomyces sp. T159_Od127]
MPKNYYAMSTPQPLYLVPPIEYYPTPVPRYWAQIRTRYPMAPLLVKATAESDQQVLPRGMPETPPGIWALLAPAHTSTAFFAPGQYYAHPAPAMPSPPLDHPDTYYLPQL